MFSFDASEGSLLRQPGSLPLPSSDKPLLIDPRGRPLSETNRGRMRILHQSAEPSHSTLLQPAIKRGLPKEFAETPFHSSEAGLYFPDTPEREAISTDLSQAPREIREQASFDYFDFSEREIQAVLEAHERYRNNLFSRQPGQQAIYFTRLAEAAGFPADIEDESSVYSFLKAAITAIATERAASSSNTPVSPREIFLTEHLHNHSAPQHPIGLWSDSGPDQMLTRRQRDGKSVDAPRKIYLETPYKSLALLFLPDVWGDLATSERMLLLDSLVMLYENTSNPEEIDSPELWLRLGEIARTESSAGVRSLIYLLCDLVPYSQIPTEAKHHLATAIRQRGEYRVPIAVSLLTDPQAADTSSRSPLRHLRTEYLAFKEDILQRLARPLSELARLPFLDWMKLVKDVGSLNLLSITDDPQEAARLEQEPFGIELELSSYEHLFPYEDGELDRLEELAERTRQALDALNQPLGLSSADQDCDCIEVRTSGPIPFSVEALLQLHRSLRSVEAHLPSQVASLHVHTDRGRYEEAYQTSFSDARVNNEFNTLEVRSFRPPVTRLEEGGKSINNPRHTDIVSLEKSIAYLALRDKFNESASLAYDLERGAVRDFNLDHFPAREGVRKILAIACFGRDPRQRAATIALLQHPPLFLSSFLIADKTLSVCPPSESVDYLLAGQELGYQADEISYFNQMGILFLTPEQRLDLAQRLIQKGRIDGLISVIEQDPSLYSQVHPLLSSEARKKIFRELVSVCGQDISDDTSSLHAMMRQNMADGSPEDQLLLELITEDVNQPHNLAQLLHKAKEIRELGDDMERWSEIRTAGMRLFNKILRYSHDVAKTIVLQHLFLFVSYDQDSILSEVTILDLLKIAAAGSPTIFANAMKALQDTPEQKMIDQILFHRADQLGPYLQPYLYERYPHLALESRKILLDSLLNAISWRGKRELVPLFNHLFCKEEATELVTKIMTAIRGRELYLRSEEEWADILKHGFKKIEDKQFFLLHLCHHNNPSLIHLIVDLFSQTTPDPTNARIFVHRICKIGTTSPDEIHVAAKRQLEQLAQTTKNRTIRDAINQALNKKDQQKRAS